MPTYGLNEGATKYPANYAQSLAGGIPTAQRTPAPTSPTTAAFSGLQTTQRAAAPTTAPKAPGVSSTLGSMTMPTTFAPSSPFGAFNPPPPPTQAPGNNLVNPGYTEQAFDFVQNRLLEDPSQGLLQNQYQQTQTPSTGENFLNQNLGTLSGPGQGDQYWNQVQGQFMNPMGGEQFARQATQQFQAAGPASSFFGNAMGQYDQFTGYSGPQNAQGQYGQSAGQLAGGTQGEQGMGQIAGGYDQFGQYTGPNLAAGQYGQTQQAFGDLPIANFDPFYDRARQLATQDYNRQAAGRGVYGSSEALSGVGNVITDIEAQRANRAFDAEMAREQALQGRMGILGNQARQGDLSSLAGFGANLAGAETFAGINRDMGNLELGRNQLLGNMANAADSQALGAQQANISGLGAFGNIAGQADSAETNRYQATTGAMDQADRTGLARMGLGADIAFRGDDSARADFTAQANAANQAAGLGLDRTRLGADIANTASANDLNRLSTFMQGANIAEGDRQARIGQSLDDAFRYSTALQQAIQSGAMAQLAGDQAAFDDYWNAQVVPDLQRAGLDQQRINTLRQDIGLFFQAVGGMGGTGAGGAAPRPLDPDNPYD